MTEQCILLTGLLCIALNNITVQYYTMYRCTISELILRFISSLQNEADC